MINCLLGSPFYIYIGAPPSTISRFPPKDSLLAAGRRVGGENTHNQTRLKHAHKHTLTCIGLPCRRCLSLLSHNHHHRRRNRNHRCTARELRQQRDPLRRIHNREHFPKGEREREKGRSSVCSKKCIGLLCFVFKVHYIIINYTKP